MDRKRILLGVGIGLLALALLGAGAFLYWANDSAPPMPEALTALKSDEFVQFSDQNGWLVFRPASQGDTLAKPLNTGFILYPGGGAASMYANNNRDKIHGIVFYAAYPAGNMSTYPGSVTSIFGTNDGLATPAKIVESKPNLPLQTVFVPIEGGNHSRLDFMATKAATTPRPYRGRNNKNKV